MNDRQPHGLFVGLTTLDFVYLANQTLGANQKQVATDYTVAAGGPATNAAIAFRSLGGAATVVSVVGQHPITQLIRADLQAWQVDLWDLLPHHQASPPVSSIVVTATTGERAVISINASKVQVEADAVSAEVLNEVDVVLIDGHQMAIGAAIARLAKARSIPVVVDGGSWKPGFETVLQQADYVIGSANFHPPGCATQEAAISYLKQLGVPFIAMTNGSAPIVYHSAAGSGQLSVPTTKVVDTLGAGDIFHGAFCYFILQHSFVDSLAGAAKVAARSCESFGTRQLLL
ncbi:MAG TPA: sugar kinase [Leptolyngbyaceae cyanobacterium M33_DOE_097]|uniref:Sugar kinase n=1 Tax=Oscillatoriales cyanobacterium SpSt-418 TaxID=2282169 RepID=A0A7C3PIH3_9CYAN|nr:sugar kinase [Leptolyngbyaceae cyanobacterium M33_DOE_097]